MECRRRRRQLEVSSCCFSATWMRRSVPARSQIVVHSRAVSAEPALQTANLPGDGIRTLRSSSRLPVRRRTAWPNILEHLPRVDLHQHGCRRRPPRQACSCRCSRSRGARADRLTVFGRLHRGSRVSGRFAARRSDRRYSRVRRRPHFGRTPLSHVVGLECGVLSAARWPARDHVEVVPERLEQFQDGENSEAFPSLSASLVMLAPWEDTKPRRGG